MKISSLLVAFLAVASAVSTASAENITTWTGAAGDGNFYTPGNWDKGAPGEVWTVRFTNDTWLTTIGDPTILYGFGGKWIVENGAKVYFAKGSKHYICANPAIVDVAVDSLLVVSNGFTAWAGGTFIKRGAGILRTQGEINSNNNSWNRLEIEAGKLEFEQLASGTAGTDITNVFVHSDAELSYLGKPGKHSGNIAMHIETNGVLRLNGTTDTTFAAFSGAGQVIAEGETRFTIYDGLTKTNEPPFTGTFSGNMIVSFLNGYTAGAGPRFVLQRGDTFKNISRVRRPGAIVLKKGLTDVDYLPDGYDPSLLRLEDEDGGPVSLDLGIYNAGSLTYVGSGSLVYRSPTSTETTKTGADFGANNLLFNGVFGVGTNTYATINKADASGNYLDMSGNGNITGLRMVDNGEFRFQDPVDETIGVSVTGRGQIMTSAGKRTFTAFDTDDCTKLTYYKEIEFAGGDGRVEHLYPATKGIMCTVSAGRVHNGESVGAGTIGLLPTPDGIDTTAMVQTGPITVSGGEFAWGSGNGLTGLYMTGGRTWFTLSNAYNTNPYFVFDGGEAIVDMKNVSANDPFYFIRKQSNSTNWVGAAGGRVRAVNTSGRYVYVAANTGVWPEAGTSGELSYYGNALWWFNTAFNLNGPIYVKDGQALVGCDLLKTASERSFGTGEFRLGNAVLNFYPDWTAAKTPAALNLAALAYGGASVIRFRNYDNSLANKFCAQHIEAGSLRRMGKGAVLFLRENVEGRENCLGEPGFSTFKVASGLANAPGLGFVREPIVVVGSLLNHFASYDATDGVKAFPLDAYMANNTFEGTTADDLVKVSGSITCSQPDAYAAGILQYESYNAKFSVAKGSTLHVGDGTNPGQVHFYINTSVAGEGTLDFGTSEGMFVAASCEAGRHNAVNCAISGSGGVSYVGYYSGSTTLRAIEIGAANGYTGGTWVNGCTVFPRNALAFSSGAVTVGAGESRGGRVRFIDPLTFANAFTVGGWGTGDGSSTIGCLVFDAAATVAGPVTITEDARIGATAGVVGTISGQVSGGRLIAYGSGTVRLTGNNVHTGGSEAFNATLAVSSVAALGSGEVALNGGVLRFENAEPETFTNLLRGTGSVQLTGGEVKFRGDMKRLDPGTVLDIPGSAVTLTETPPFASITNTTDRTARLILAAPGRFTVDPAAFGGKFNLTLESGATLDLGGGTLTVRRFEGDPDAVNGTIVETNPKRGLLILFR